ncbi:MAG: right-handed parallel beta-helix repeat-containing protein [Planctomycetes bacterium]|nr:right-handed parallel beta-helix repeat-containing protein [Planctomycetota bacterium]
MQLRTSILVTLAFSFASTAHAGTHYVDRSLTTGANDGSSWADAFRDADGVAAALAVATAGDEVWVAAGSYVPTTLGTRSSSHVLKVGVVVYGGFAGGETSVSQRDVLAHPTILTGDLAGDDAGGNFGENSFHVVVGSGTDATAVLDGFTIRGGNANVSGANQDRGGGVLCIGGAGPTIRNCVFTANRCTFGGGAGYANAAGPSFIDCVFDANVGGSFGGAFDFANGANVTIDRCVFRNNSAARAGAVELFANSGRVFNSLFYANTSTGAGSGGALYVQGGSPQIRNCTVVQNQATGSSGGGGLRIASGSPVVTNCIFDQNTASGGASGPTAQISPVTAVVTYSLIPAGFAGTGNLAATPSYDATGPFPFRLAASSPGVDAGDNAGIGGAGLALAGAPRRLDVFATPDAGVGAAPIVDMGAFESDGDCNANGVADWTDIALGTSFDVDGDTVPDECECAGGTPPLVYCTAKFNSQLCLPAIAHQGTPSVSSASAFTLSASQVLNNKNGMLFYGYGVQAVPFQGGTLCVTLPIQRTSVQNSGGSASGTDCSGTFTFDFNAWIQTGGDPQLVAGQLVGVQFWSRDPQDAFTSSLTDAVRFAICQ